MDVAEATSTVAGTPSSRMDCTVLPPPRRLVPSEGGVKEGEEAGSNNEVKKTKLFSESMTTHYSLVHWLASLINIFIGAIN